MVRTNCIIVGGEERKEAPVFFMVCGCVVLSCVGRVAFCFAWRLASPLPPFLVSHKVSRQKGCRLVQVQVISCPRLVLLCLWCWGGFGYV